MPTAVIPYNRKNAAEYAKRWALSRNPLYTNYAGIGGDCTNFISQCVLAGSCEMNFTPVYGWYYLSQTERTASWTGVEFFYEFMTKNISVGPFASEASAGSLMIGDVIQLGKYRSGMGMSEENSIDYYHTLIVTGYNDRTYLVSAHTDDALDRPLDTYSYDAARFLHIEGVRIMLGERYDCFNALLNGEMIPGRPMPPEML